MKQLRQPSGGTSSTASSGRGSAGSWGHGCGSQGGNFFPPSWGGFQAQGSTPPFLPQQPSTLKCYLCRGPHLHKEHQGATTRLVINDQGKWVDKALGVRSSASYSTPTLPGANEISLVPTTIPVPSAEISHMVPQNVALNSIFPIVTKLKLDAWEHALRDAGILGEYSDIPAGLRNGFLCGLEHQEKMKFLYSLSRLL